MKRSNLLLNIITLSHTYVVISYRHGLASRVEVQRVLRVHVIYEAQATDDGVSSPPEILTELRRTGGAVVGRLRLVDYMNPQDPLYFDARRKAVSIADYDVRMTKCDNV